MKTTNSKDTKKGDPSSTHGNKPTYGTAMAVAVLSFLLLPVLVLLTRKEFPVHSEGGAILISGTSSGIGRATCQWFAEHYPNSTIYCGVRRTTTGSPFDFPNVKQVMLDTTNPAHIQAVLTEEIREPLIGLINNAGIYELSPFEFTGVDRLRQVFEVNVMGTYQLTQAALPLLRENKGRILTMSSSSGIIPGVINHAAYGGSKAAIEAMYDSLRVELAPLGVSVSLIEPGWLPSNLQQQVDDLFSSLDTNNAAAEIYPHAINQNYIRQFTAITQAVGTMEETLRAMEHAMFDKYPKPRYITARLGAFPTWLVVWMFRLLPTRWADLVSSHLEPNIQLIHLRDFLGQRILGMIV